MRCGRSFAIVAQLSRHAFACAIGVIAAKEFLVSRNRDRLRRPASNFADLPIGIVGAIAGGLFMPTLFRFLLSLLVLAGVVMGSMYSLATFVHPKPREIVIRVPPDRFLPPQQ
jgi:hypothetical protein